MGSHGLRIELELPLDQVAVLLHQTADGLSAGALRVGDEVLGLDSLRELHLCLRRVGDDVRLQIRGRPHKAARSAPPRGRYKALKKQMSRTWKDLQRLARQGALPDAELGGRFVEQGEHMMGYPDKGSAFYPAFARALTSLRDAVGSEDIEEFRSAVARIGKLKKAAHRRYR